MNMFNLTREEIIYRLGYYRNKRNMSGYELSQRLGHAPSYIYRLESNKINFSIDTLLDILSILEVSTFEFFCPDIFKEVSDIKLLKNLSDKDQEALLNVIKMLKK